MKKIFKKRKKLIIILAIIVVVIVGLIIYGKNKLSQMAQDSNAIELQEIQKRDLSDYISLSGSVSGENKMNFSSSAAAEIKTMNVAVGDEVKEGDVLAVLDTAAIQSQIDMIETSMSNAEALEKNQNLLNKRALDQAKADQKTQLSSAEQAISDAQSQYDDEVNSCNQLISQIEELKNRMNSAENEQEKEALEEQLNGLEKELAGAKSSVSAASQAVTQAKNNYNSVKSTTDEAIFSAQNAVDMQKYSKTDNTDTKTQLEGLYNQLNDCTITSSINGIVTAVHASVGDTNTPNSSLITVENDNTLIMSAPVDEKDILKLKEGMKAIVTAGALDDQEIKGEVVKVVRVYGGAAADANVMPMGMSESTGNTTGGYSVQIKLENSDLLSGMTTKAKITISNRSDILSVPYDLVKKEEDGKTYVLCGELQDDGKYKAVRKDVQLGEEVDYYVEVLSGDVKEGDYIIMDYEIQEGDIFEGNIALEEETEDGMAETVE